MKCFHCLNHFIWFVSLSLLKCAFNSHGASPVICLQCRRPRFNSWVGKIPWKRDRLPTPVFLGFPGGCSEMNWKGYCVQRRQRWAIIYDWRDTKDALFKYTFVLADVETYLYIIHTSPQCSEGCVHDFSFSTPFLHDANTLVGQNQLGDMLWAFSVWLIRLSRTLHMVVVLPDISGWLVPAHDFTEDVHHVKVIFRVSIYDHDNFNSGVG